MKLNVRILGVSDMYEFNCGDRLLRFPLIFMEDHGSKAKSSTDKSVDLHWIPWNSRDLSRVWSTSCPPTVVTNTGGNGGPLLSQYVLRGHRLSSLQFSIGALLADPVQCSF